MSTEDTTTTSAVDGTVDGAVDPAAASTPPPGAAPTPPPAPSSTPEEDVVAAEEQGVADITDELTAMLSLAEERLGDLQRLQAEYVNYRRRVDRDRDVARDTAVSGVLEALLPVLDDVHLARQHGDLAEGPFSAITDKLEAVLGRLGLARYGEVGEEFDPAVHEALLSSSDEAATSTTVTTVLQPGYRVGARVLRPARVAVTGPA